MHRTGTVVVGGGQAGLALSHWLTLAGQDHVVLERGDVGQRWRDRWPSLRLLTPNRHNRLPGAGPLGPASGFATRDDVVRHLSDYAVRHDVPLATGTPVDRARLGPAGFEVVTPDGTWVADNLVVATGHAAAPVVPALSGGLAAEVRQLHTSAYRGPASVGDGPVVVVGAGASGQQVAAELARAGREVAIAVGRHRRLPRRYRGADIWTWLGLVGDLDATVDDVPDVAAARRAPSAALSGRGGGEQLDLGVLAGLGVAVHGRLGSASGFRLGFDGSLAASVRDADLAMAGTLARVDALLDRAGHRPSVAHSPDLHIADAGASRLLPPGGTVVWATGFRPANPWLQVPAPVVGGALVQRRGVTEVPGLYVLGLRFQHRRRSHFLGGVGEDAHDVAAHIVARPSSSARRGHRRRPRAA
jgi:putative flavoprotein involved in K+ transport